MTVKRRVYIQYSPDMIEFLAARRDAGQEDHAIAVRMMNTNMVDSDAPNYLDLIWDEGKAVITYTTQDKYDRACSEEYVAPYERKGFRTKTRPARIVKHFMSYEDGRANDVFAQAAQAYLQRRHDAAMSVTLLRGDLIGKWYDVRLYCTCSKNHSGMHNSCMRYQEYDKMYKFEIYKDNAEMAVILCECGKLAGRAIVWHDRDNDKKYMDRVYGSPTNAQILMDWARENGIPCVWGNQRTQSPPKDADGYYPRIALMHSDYIPGNWHPYLDSTSICSSCDHIIFNDFSHHKCGAHDHHIERPTMEWDKDLPLADIKHGECEHCGEERFRFTDPDDGESTVQCPHYEYCDWCEFAHCNRYTCHHVCEHCDEAYGLYDSCPNTRRCECGHRYCRHDEDGCPNSGECETCGWEGCGPCQECNSMCDYCHQWNPNDAEYCTGCQTKCGTCKNAYRNNERVNGRCPICWDIQILGNHRRDYDFAKPAYDITRDMIQEARQRARNTANDRGNWDWDLIDALDRVYIEVDAHLYDLSPEYTLESQYRYVNNAIRDLIDDHGVAPYTVILPLGVRHDIWLNEATTPEVQ